MTPMRHILLVAELLWLATVGQGRLAHVVSIAGAQPDFPLVVLSCGTLLVGRAAGIWLGFWGGMLTAVSSPLAYGSLFVSRIAAGTFAGALGQNLIRGNVFVSPLVTLACTGLAELLTTLLAPGYAVHHLRHWGIQFGGELIYNSLLAIPVSLLLRGLRVGEIAQDSFGRLS